MIKPSKTVGFTFLAIIVLIIFIILYNRINSNSLIIYTVFIVTLMIALFLGFKKGVEISLESRNR